MITLFKGDDTHGQLGKKCFIKFHCDDTVDMTNVRVRFNLINIVTKDFENVHDGSELEIFISHQDARKLPLGITHGKLWGEDSSGKIRTFANRIPFGVTTDLRKVYGSDGLDSVDVHVYASVDWDSIANKPTLFPSKVSMVEGLEEALAQAGKVKTVNGRSPDESGNIEIDIPSAKVSSVNGKTGDVEITAQDIPYGGEGASNVETAVEQNTQDIATNAEAIESLGEQLSEVKDATYTKEEIDQKISQSEAHYLTAKVNGSFVQFATHAALAAAKAAHTEENPQFWYGDDPHTPDKNDYCTILDDETHGHATTRYMFVGEWPDGFFRYQYTVNPTALTQAQWDALNSGAKKEKIDAIDEKLAKSDVVDPATATTTGKAADAKKVAEELAGKIDKRKDGFAVASGLYYSGHYAIAGAAGAIYFCPLHNDGTIDHSRAFILDVNGTQDKQKKIVAVDLATHELPDEVKTALFSDDALTKKISGVAEAAITDKVMSTEGAAEGSVSAKITALETAITGVAEDLAAAIGEVA